MKDLIVVLKEYHNKKTQREDIQQYQETIETVIIDEEITTSEAYLFTEMTNLKQVTLPTSLISIGTYAFSQSGTTTITIPKNVTTIGEYTFKQCKSFKKEIN